ncbi:MAG: alcohol dehydrogenase [Planctomycetes bacterium]|nr:alcohol dehydrogenase [Planctomycetota bacterium]
MRGLHLDCGILTLRDDLPEPESRTDWTRVQVAVAGICATDRALARGYLDFRGVPGHEFVGTALDGPLQGRRVVGEINAGCGACGACATGDSRHCAQRTVLGIAGLQGALAERLALPTANLLVVPDAVDDEAATFTEPLAAALHVADDVDLAAHSRALVAGDGKLGLLCAMALQLHGCEVTLAGRHPERAALLRRPPAFARGWLEAVPAERGPADHFDLAVEATGDPTVLARLLPLVRPRGTIVLKTTAEQPAEIDLGPFVVRELRLVGSRCGRFRPALDALAGGLVDARGLVSARYPLGDGVAAFQHAAEPGVLEVLVRCTA